MPNRQALSPPAPALPCRPEGPALNPCYRDKHWVSLLQLPPMPLLAQVALLLTESGQDGHKRQIGHWWLGFNGPVPDCKQTFWKETQREGSYTEHCAVPTVTAGGSVGLWLPNSHSAHCHSILGPSPWSLSALCSWLSPASRLAWRKSRRHDTSFLHVHHQRMPWSTALANHWVCCDQGATAGFVTLWYYE